MANKASLVPFKKGQDHRRNIDGRPKALPNLTEKLVLHLGATGIDDLIQKLHELAMSGNVKAIEMLLDRGYGKAKETIDLSTSIAAPDYHEFLKHLKDPNV
jgi:pantothenate kinase